MLLGDYLGKLESTVAGFARRLGRPQRSVWRWTRPPGSAYFNRPTDADLALIVRESEGHCGPPDFHALPPALWVLWWRRQLGLLGLPADLDLTPVLPPPLEPAPGDAPDGAAPPETAITTATTEPDA